MGGSNIGTGLPIQLIGYWTDIDDPYMYLSRFHTVRGVYSSHRKRTKRKVIPEVIHCVLGARRTKREKRNRRRRVD